MQVTAETRRRERLQGILFPALLLGCFMLLAWLSHHAAWRIDWSAGGRYSLPAASVETLRALDGEVEILAFARSAKVRRQVRRFLQPYLELHPQWRLRFIDPLAAPEQVRTHAIEVQGELVVLAGARRHKLSPDSRGRYAQRDLTGALQRLLRERPAPLVFLGGHGERRATGEANHDLGEWGTYLAERGYPLREWSLADGALPTDTGVLVLAGAQVALPTAEVEALLAYLRDGGNLLWLLDPKPEPSLEPLADQLGVRPAPGLVLQSSSLLQKTGDPSILPVAASGYMEHPALHGFDLVTLFAGSAALLSAPRDWKAVDLIRSDAEAWLETGPLRGEVGYDPAGDVRGPLALAVALERPAGERSQRVVVVGDGDFLSNAYLANGGNVQLGLRLVDWLSGTEALLGTPPPLPDDAQLQLPVQHLYLLVAVFCMFLPVILLGTGELLRRRRHRR